jgi:hypothetical protein
MFERLSRLWRCLSGQKARPEEERRVWVRHPCDFSTVLQPTHDGHDQRLSARVSNVSRGGLNLTVSREFTPGEMLSVQFPGPTPGSTSTILACVIHARRSGDTWNLGCAFSEELSDEELALLGLRGASAKPSEARARPRLPCHTRVHFQLVQDQSQPPVPAQVVNISSSGIGLRLDRPLETGSLLDLQLQSPSGDVTRQMLACVVHVTSQPNREWLIGCNFIHEMPEEDVRALL